MCLDPVTVVVVAAALGPPFAFPRFGVGGDFCRPRHDGGRNQIPRDSPDERGSWTLLCVEESGHMFQETRRLWRSGLLSWGGTTLRSTLAANLTPV